ncbi:MAG TPA: 3-oxoacyl-ACP reductase family protein [Spirochaetota bacterium]|nr:3-oxoacyl-ACP reductase family protein [Spirochaetota bacterium]
MLPGGGQGIGRAIVHALVKEKIVTVIADINEQSAKEVVKEVKDAGHEAVSFKTDVSNVTDIKNMVKEVGERYKTIDILVNNAGILQTTAIDDITEQEWNRLMAVNLNSVFFTSQQVLPYMREKRWGRIINMSSLAGRMGSYGGGVGYATTKAGIIGLTMCFARQVAQYDVTVNAVAPGTTETDIIKKIPDDKITALKSLIPMGRLGKPENTADVVTFLASEKAEYITGAVIDVNGGIFMG